MARQKGKGNGEKEKLVIFTRLAAKNAEKGIMKEKESNTLPQKIAIIGCGWLGFPLAKAFLQSRHVVYGSTTSENKLGQLAEAGILPFLYDGTTHDVLPDWTAEIDVVILNFPPSKSVNYAEHVSRIIASFSDSCKILFTSSTGVYLPNSGTVGEDAPLLESGVLFQAEQAVKMSKREATIVRLAGLLGEKRHPVRFMSGKTISHGSMPVNLVHLYDVIAAIETIVSQGAWNKTYNVCWPEHPTKVAFYSQAAHDLLLPPPIFDDSLETGKVVSSARIEQELSFQFRYPIDRVF